MLFFVYCIFFIDNFRNYIFFVSKTLLCTSFFVYLDFSVQGGSSAAITDVLELGIDLW